jgi:hypothetical protein
LAKGATNSKSFVEIILDFKNTSPTFGPFKNFLDESLVPEFVY